VSILALLASVLLLTAGTNLQGILLPLRRQMEGSSMQQIGLLSSGWSFGFVLACLVVGRLVSSVGHVRSFAGLAALNAAMSLLLLPLNDETLWVVLRVIIGFCFGGLSMVIESWLNERSGPKDRGGIFAAYMTVSLLASLGGTLTLEFVDAMSPLPYTLMGVAVVLSIVPMALTRVAQPLPVEPFSIDLPALYRVSPTGVFGCFAVGLVGGALGGLLPAYGLSMSMATGSVATLIAASLIGGALAYYPAGAVSDRIDRRTVIVVLSGLSVALCAFIVTHPFLSHGQILAAVGAFGFCQYPLYGLCVAMTNDRVREQSYSEVASELLIIHGIGTVLGPPLAAVCMRNAPEYLFLFMGAVLLVLAGFAARRTQVRAEPPAALKTKCSPMGALPHSMQMFRPQPNLPIEKEGAEP
jgi:MFS family permease